MAAEGPGDGGRRPARPGARYSLFVGIAFLALIAVATLNTINTDSPGVLGSEAGIRGEPLPEFAVPRLPGGPDSDANVAQDDCETAENPCPADARRTPACRIQTRGAIRVCDLFGRPLVISFWFTSPSGCPPTQDAVNAVAHRYRGRVNFLSIAVRGDRDEIERIARERDWTIPLGWDRDGAVSNIYRVGVCPTLAFAYPGGEFWKAEVGEDNLAPGALAAQVRHLIGASRARGPGRSR